jgi:hypothetical protein
MKTKNFKVRFGYNKKDGRFFSFKKLMKHVAEKELLTKEQRTSMWNSFKENVTSNLVIR